MRLNSDFETKFDYADDLLRDYIQENPSNNETKEIIFNLLLLKELMQTKSNEVNRIERDLKMREENLAERLNNLSIDHLEQFSDMVMKKRIDETEKNIYLNDTGYKLQKIHLTYYFDELENFVEILKKSSSASNYSNDDKKSESADLKKSQTKSNLLINNEKIITTGGNKVNLNNSLIGSKNYENQISKTTPNENTKTMMMQPSPNQIVNTKINTTTPSYSKTPSLNNKTQPTTASTSTSITYTKKTTGSIDSMQNLNNFKNSTSAVKNPSVIDSKAMASNKSLLHSVESIKKLEEIEKDHDVQMLKGSDDLLVDSGFDSDKDNQEIYEKKRKERLKSKQNISQNTFEPIAENDSSFVEEPKKKFPRSLSNLGPSVRNLKNGRSDSNNSITSTPSNKNLTNSVRKINRDGAESKSNANLDLTYLKEGGNKKFLDSIVNQNRVGNDLNSSIKLVRNIFY
jgi:hypothetical protein